MRCGCQIRRVVTKASFTHVNNQDSSRPSMVNIGSKKVTTRVAVAEARLRGIPVNEYHSNKEKIQMAVEAAAVQGALSTPDIIPFCHPLMPLGTTSRCFLDNNDLVVQATSSTPGKTGVEMEALAAAAFAALTAARLLNHRKVDSVLLRSKSGGKSGSVSFDDNAQKIVDPS
eukprot:TRINITY_DN1633_c0_g1_i1.p1 TRINITY_DN1633_c0_g1~~TRINITY_DN1633_c0_g1_i1.p1  ORF type:complete len:172 (+),score=26.41 TRINITY_DN1633_c0_g1_i1:746-1261(+)